MIGLEGESWSTWRKTTNLLSVHVICILASDPCGLQTRDPKVEPACDKMWGHLKEEEATTAPMKYNLSIRS